MRNNLISRMKFTFLLLLLSSSAVFAQEKAEKANAHALTLLAEGDAKGAEASARQSLAASSRFDPQAEIVDRPEKGILFEDMITEARESYRERRGRYYLTLGRVLTRLERWIEARKALRRAASLMTLADPYLVMSTHADLSVKERIALLLRAYFATGADPEVVKRALWDTGAFVDPNALQARIDQRRIEVEIAPEYPDTEVRLGSLPEIRSATQQGMFISTEHFREGKILALYMPAVGCGRCSEELDGLNRAVREARGARMPVVPAMFVDASDLAAARRITRLLAFRIEVGRLDKVPWELRQESDGAIWVVGSRGLLQIKIPLGDCPHGREVSDRVEAVLRHIDVGKEDEEVPADEALKEIRQLELKGRTRLLTEAIALAARREAGPASMEELYSIILRSTRSKVEDADDPLQVIEILAELSALHGAGEAKAKALTSLDDQLGKKLLNAARTVEPGIDRQASSQSGIFELFVSKPIDEASERQIVLRRSFRGVETLSLQHFNFVLRAGSEGIDVMWVGLEREQVRGLGHAAGGALFFFERAAACSGLRLVTDGTLTYEGCPARLLESKVVEEKPVLIDPFTAGPSPTYFEEISEEPAETALERGRDSFDRGQYAAAASAFKEAAAEIDPLAPYEETDLRYNRARCLEAEGKLREALALFESIGDVTYQDLVDEKIRALGGGIR